MNLYQQAKKEFEVKFWTNILSQCGGEVGKVAKFTGVNRTDVYKRLHRLGLKFTCKLKRGNWGDLV